MGRVPDTPCSDCGRLLWRGGKSMPTPTCRDCRAARPERGFPPPVRTEGMATVLCCGNCGEPFERLGIRHHAVNYCSPACRAEVRKRSNRRWSQRRESRLRSAWVEAVDRMDVAKRDGWRCHICDGRVDGGLAWPHPLSASIDHLVPIAAGGSHSMANVALAHLRCNISKGTKPAGEQLRLIG